MKTMTYRMITAPLLATLCMLAFAAALAFTSTAYANTTLAAPTTVSDDITRVHVAKLDADTHEYVSGATMAIIDKETGEVVDSWVTEDGVVHEYEKGVLVVEHPYILREISAPEGYSTVDDVEFIINEDEGRGLTIVSGTAGQYEQTTLDRITLYDKAGETEVVTTVAKTRAKSSSTSSKVVAPKTGDETPLLPIAVFAVVGIAAICILQVSKSRLSK